MATQLPQPYHTIVFHHHPHIEELLVLWIIVRFGDPRVFSPDLKVIYWDAGPFTPDGRSPEAWAAEGYLLVGVGGGKYDEHAGSLGECHDDSECSATLVAHAFEFDQMLELDKLFEYVLHNDRFGGDATDTATTIWKMWDTDPDQVIPTAFAFFDLRRKDRLDYLHAGQTADQATIREVVLTDGTLRIAAIQSDEPKMASWLTSRGKCHVAIVERSNGQKFIKANQEQLGFLMPQVGGLNYLTDLVRTLRVEECLATGRSVPSWERLGAVGTISEVPEWHYHHKVQTVMNGSNSSPGKVASKLSLELILDRAEVALNPWDLPDGCRSSLKCVGESCPRHAVGLKRCQLVRIGKF